MTPALWIALSVIVGLLGRDRTLGFAGYFTFSLLFSPILMLLVLLLGSPRRSYHNANRTDTLI